MAGKGGKRVGAGRPAGAVNKATADIKAIAREYTPKAVAALLKLVEREDSPATQLGAAKEILDRAYGKSTQLVGGDESAAAIRTVHEIVLRGIRSDANDRHS